MRTLTLSSSLREEALDQHKAIRREANALRKLAGVLRHFLCKKHTGLCRTLSAIDLRQESVDIDRINRHVSL